MSRGIFVTGTDTGVGKTFVTALLLAELRRGGQPAGLQADRLRPGRAG